MEGMRIATVVLFVLALTCCTTFQPRHERLTISVPGIAAIDQPTQTECDQLSSRVLGWGASAVGAAALTGSSGIGFATTDVTSQGAKIGLGITIAVLSAWGAVSGYLSAGYAQQRTAACVPASK
jgi:hypothetical protein